ncbi:MAG: hemerythrin-like metal-binding protein [Proteobacteria bacterium]|nr:hemerythrin-like metal-binding protein [Pseudomonadota bacterium]
MSWIAWKEEYRVGNEIIDHDHQALFKLINAFYDAFQESKLRRELLHILNELVAYSEEHFQREELIMAAHNYPGLEEHHHLHEKLYETIYALNSRLHKDPRPLERETIAFLKNWLTDHILLHDLALGEFINKEK